LFWEVKQQQQRRFDMATYKDQKKTWLASNPLRQWRKKEKLFLDDVGAAVGVGYHMVYQWENGMSEPREDQFDKLSELMSIENLQTKYQEWAQTRPILGKE
jgi:DNA-binding transcriptional regulator YiaG